MISSTNIQLSIIIPVYNETASINLTLGHLVESMQGILSEVIVVDGNPQGNTIAAINPCFNSGKIKLKRIISKKSGRAVQMNAGAKIARRQFLMFLHADTILSYQAVRRIPRSIKDTSVLCGAFSLGIQHPGKAYRLIEFMANFRNRITRLPYGDQAQFFRKDYFENLGGYSDIPLMEDVEIMQRVKMRKDRCRIFPEKVFTSARRWEKEGILYCTLRNWMLISLYSLGVSPRRLATYYGRHNN
jgi:rSAM/selenodomain-associated transferase 2